MVKKAFLKTAERPRINDSILVWDWKSYFGPHIRPLKAFKDFRAFKFQLDKDNDAVFFYKKSILDAIWNGFEDSQTEGITFYI